MVVLFQYFKKQDMLPHNTRLSCNSASEICRNKYVQISLVYFRFYVKMASKYITVLHIIMKLCRCIRLTHANLAGMGYQ